MKKPLYGHTTEATAYLVNDYPYGRTIRCRIRYWVEYKEKKGFRLMAQTENPKTLRWNKPAASTYARMAGQLYLEEGTEHVKWDQLTEYDNGETALAFVKTFPGASFQVLSIYAGMKVKYLEGLLSKKLKHVLTVNGEEQEQSAAQEASDAARWRAELSVWKEVHALLPLKDNV